MDTRQAGRAVRTVLLYLFAAATFYPLCAFSLPVRPGICSGCTTEAQLFARAQQVAYQTTEAEHIKLFIASDTEPMAGFYEARLYTVDPDPWYSGDEYLAWEVWQLTMGDEAAKLLDNIVFSRKLVFDIPEDEVATASDVATDDGAEADVNSC